MQKKEYNHYHLSSVGGRVEGRGAALAELDLVYPVKFMGGMFDGDELKYSLRSVVANLPHRKVFVIADHKPMWMSVDVRMMSIKDRSANRFENVNRKLLEACKSSAISDPFILMNDDFFVMKPVTDIPCYRYGTLKQHHDDLAKVYRSKYMHHIERAMTILKERGLQTNDFEVHSPIIVYKDALKEVLSWDMASACRRSLYCNYMGERGVLTKDFKVYTDGEDFNKNATFISTLDSNFANGAVGRYIKEKFSEHCHYEKRGHR